LDVDCEPLLARHQARPLGHGPTEHHAVELEPQVVVQRARSVLLDDILVAPCRTRGTARLGRLLEVAFSAIGSQRRHVSSPSEHACAWWRRAYAHHRAVAAHVSGATEPAASRPTAPLSRCGATRPSG